MHAAHNIDDTTIIFNTNCRYTSDGQIIVARKIDGAVIFADVSRMIVGTIDAADCPKLDSYCVNQCYLHSRYRHWIDDRTQRDELEQLARDHGHRVPIVD